MEAKTTTGAETSPLRRIEVMGAEVNVDASRARNYKTLKLCGVMSAPDSEPYEKAAAVMELAGYLSDWDEGRIVERFGGDDASVEDVMGFAIAVISEAISKN